MPLTTKTNVPRNSARNSLSIPCLSAQCCLMLLVLPAAGETKRSRAACTSEVHNTHDKSPPPAERSHSEPIIDPIYKCHGPLVSLSESSFTPEDMQTD